MTSILILSFNFNIIIITFIIIIVVFILPHFILFFQNISGVIKEHSMQEAVKIFWNHAF